MGLLPKSLLMYTLPLDHLAYINYPLDCLAYINYLGGAMLREGDLFEKRERTKEDQ